MTEFSEALNELIKTLKEVAWRDRKKILIWSVIYLVVIETIVIITGFRS